MPAAVEDRKFVVFGMLDYASGRIVHQCSEQKSEAAFVAFLGYLAQAWPADEPLVVVLDNVGYHKSYELRTWWQQHTDRFQPF